MPEDIPKSKPRSEREDALAVLRRLRDAGHVAYFAGGCVRDLLLGLTPKDFDVATDAPPRRVRELFSSTQAVGAAFGVILVRRGQSQIEVATFRSDGAYLDGRHPSEVHFTTAEEDAKRRDFTINGLFLDPLTDQVIDYVGGQDDLKLRRLRAIGDAGARFSEDSLRLLRAVRFAARFGFDVESSTADAIRKHATDLRRVSPERIAEELRMMLTPAATRSAAWTLLWELTLVHEVFRQFRTELREPFDASRSLFLHLAKGEPAEFSLALATAVICYRMQTQPSMGDPRVFFGHADLNATLRTLRQLLKISNAESDAVRDILEGLGPLLADTPPRLATKMRFLARPQASGSRKLMDAMAAVGLFVECVAALQPELTSLATTEFAPTPLVNGDDLALLGIPPGPLYKRVLAEVYDAQLEGAITSKADAETMAMRISQAGDGAADHNRGDQHGGKHHGDTEARMR